LNINQENIEPDIHMERQGVLFPLRKDIIARAATLSTV
jgi:hypothetical protein